MFNFFKFIFILFFQPRYNSKKMDVFIQHLISRNSSGNVNLQRPRPRYITKDQTDKRRKKELCYKY